MQRSTYMDQVKGSTKAGRPAFLGLAGVVVALLLATTACAPAGPASPAGSPGGSPATATPASGPAHAASDAAASDAATASASATSVPATPAPAAEQWQTFTSPDAKVSFDYPTAWNVAAPSGPAGSAAINVDVRDAAGMVVASLHFGPWGGLGGACQGAVPYTVLDSAEVNLPHRPAKGSVTPRFAFRALQEPDRVTASFGLTDTPAGQNGTTCMFYNVVTGPPEWPLLSFADAFQVRAGGTEDDPTHKGAKTFPSLDAARAYMQTPEYLNAKRMITSLKINEG